MHVAHQTGMGVGVVLLFILVGGAIFIGYHFYTHSAKPFSFHYFKVRRVWFRCHFLLLSTWP